MNRPRFDELDSLRGVEATMVMLNHFFLQRTRRSSSH
jgi:peptidoglycan/LPS O-acetylase OafA/YrhL